MPAPKKDPAIYRGDTVHTIRKDGTEGSARWTVDAINPDKSEVSISRLIRVDYRRTSYRAMEFAPDRLALVRHGTALDDSLRKAGVEPDQKPHDSDRTKSPYVLDGKAHHPDQPDD
ncbi:hypothetical protein [Nocardia yamanashiensis]|uniref:hypothetical protein n=1 Tax=Nocardia yamanashiensis TaxID=209247 RepID=UPI000837871E|nr:hypothetical protein [Nocardia yamanashiensis]